MRTAVIADIHSNLEALIATLDRIRQLKADAVVCLGDMVGYNANPNETLDIIQSEHILCVLGNHDVCVAGMEEPYNFNPLARAAVLWTRDQLTEKNRQFLLSLPREQQVRDFFMFHGSIDDTNRYIFFRDDAEDNFRLLAELPGAPLIGFFGHTHAVTALIEQQGALSTRLAVDALDITLGKRYLINPGSVGQPRDGDARAAFLIYDDKAHRISFHRVDYDIRTCQEKIIGAGLPPRLAERLSWGR